METPEQRKKEEVPLERPLSPVLSTGKTSNVLRRDGRLRKSNLSRRFERQNRTSYLSELPDPSDSPEVRLRKLKEMEEKRKEYFRYLTEVPVEKEFTQPQVEGTTSQAFSHTLSDTQINDIVDVVEEDAKAEGEGYFKNVSRFLEDLKKQKAVADINTRCKNIMDLIHMLDKGLKATPVETEEMFKGFTDEEIKFSVSRAQSSLKTDVYYDDNFVTLYRKGTSRNKSLNPAKKAKLEAVLNKQKQTQEWFDSCFSDELNKNISLASSITDKSVCHSPSFGFKCASGKTIKVSEAALLKATRIFKEVTEEGKNTLVTNLNMKPNEELKNDQRYAEDAALVVQSAPTVSVFSENKPTEVNHQETLQEKGRPVVMKGFTCASGKNITISKSALETAQKLFREVQEEENKLEATFEKVIAVEDPTKVEMENYFITTDNSRTEDFQTPNGFASASGKSITVSKEALARAQKMFHDIQNENNNVSLPSTKSKGLSASEDVLSSARKVNVDCENKAESFPTLATSRTPLNEKRPFRKHLGSAARCKQIAVEQKSLEKARKLFEDITHGLRKETVTVQDITPDIPKRPFVFQDVSRDLPKRPIASVSRRELFSVEPVACTEKIVLKEAPKDGLSDWLKELTEERKRLEGLLEKVAGRQEALKEQMRLLQNAENENKKPAAGVLFNRKKSGDRLSLRQYVGKIKPGETYLNADNSNIHAINPENALHVHFSCESIIEKISDGGILVSNASNSIGLAEIKVGFETIPSVQKSLIPHGWIENHYKWIVWKLASMQRAFPQHFSDCLTLQNVMQQLKYRYDREIDNAERPALRRIMEKDDAPQKRMVLCVSRILKASGDQHELELTDGWYAVRTIIDLPLEDQIKKCRLRVGTKVITQGAELLNCSGCHPLEATSDVALKINFNRTRRTVWDAKLGFQSCQGPLRVSLKSISRKGGPVGLVKVYLARVYPLRYMEKQDGTVVWRNERAENKRKNDCDLKNAKKLEGIQEKIRSDYQNELAEERKNRKPLKADLSNAATVGDLYSIIEQSADPESLMERLSYSQRVALTEYRRRRLEEMEQNLTARVKEAVKKLQLVSRQVVPILKLVVLDADCPEDSKTVNIWKPEDELLSMLKECQIFSIYNLIPKNDGSLASSCKTRFSKEKLPVSSHFQKYSRHFLPLSTVCSFQKPFLNEFDTVGVVVRVEIEATTQDLWLTDAAGRLLLVKTCDSSDRCCLFDCLERGAIVALSNLVFCEPQNSFGVCMANQHSTVTRCPKSEVLGNKLKELQQQLPQDVEALLAESDKKVDVCITKLGFINGLQNKSYSETLLARTTSLYLSDILNDSSEDDGVLPAKLTAWDVAISMIDLDKLDKKFP